MFHCVLYITFVDAYAYFDVDIPFAKSAKIILGLIDLWDARRFTTLDLCLVEHKYFECCQQIIIPEMYL